MAFIRSFLISGSTAFPLSSAITRSVSSCSAAAFPFCTFSIQPGVLGCEESAQTESFSSGLLEYPQYTRPREFEGLTVPEPLLNGNHAHIVDWQLSESLYITLRRRPEMAKAYLDGRKFTRHQQKVVDAVFDRIREEDEAAKAQTEEQP